MPNRTELPDNAPIGIKMGFAKLRRLTQLGTATRSSWEAALETVGLKALSFCE